MKLKIQIILIVQFLFCYSVSSGQWTQSLNLPGLRVSAIVKCGDKFFAGTSTGTLHIGQLYCSPDNGLNWSLVNTGFTFSGVFSMTVRGSYIYVGTYEHGLLMSSDAGQSWVLNDMNVWKLGVFGVGVSGDDNVIAYINHGTGLALSTNDGVNWNNINPGSQISQLSAFMELPDKLLAGSRRGIALSSNNGLNWSLQAGNGLVSNPDGTKPTKAIYYFNNKLFAGCIDKIYVSEDYGNNFTATNFQLNNWEYFTSFVSLGNKLFASVATFQSSSPGIIMTTNDGANWSGYQSGNFTGKPVHSMIISDDYLIAGTSLNGIWISPLEKSTLTLTTNFEALSAQDTMTVELRSSVSPYNLIESKKSFGGHSIPQQISFTNTVDGTPYYIVVRHRNSITTWSSLPQSFTNNSVTFDFTTAISQSFGNNMTNPGGAWSFYTGDADQDGTVSAGDLSLIDNDAYNFVQGYTSTDLDLDGFVGASDLAFADNNAFNFITSISPP